MSKKEKQIVSSCSIPRAKSDIFSKIDIRPFQNCPENDHRYPDQFFDVIVDDYNLQTNFDKEYLYKSEWEIIKYQTNISFSGLVIDKLNYKELPLEHHLDTYLENEEHTKKNFLSHFSNMLKNYAEDINNSQKELMTGWLNYHLDLLKHPEKENFIKTQTKILESLPDARTKAYFIHFHVQIRSIPKDTSSNGCNIIEKPKLEEYYKNIQVYNTYLKIRENEDSDKNKIRCCNSILSVQEIESIEKTLSAQEIESVTKILNEKGILSDKQILPAMICYIKSYKNKLEE